MTSIEIKDLQRHHAGRYFKGSLLVSVGILLTTTGGSWDITNHLINKPETFFSIPHTILYSGAGIAIAGAVLMFLSRPVARESPKILPTWMALAGGAILAGSGPADFAWHLAFGLDGLLSPTHLMLVSGMIISGLGGFLGIRRSIEDGSNPKPMFTTVFSMLPVWLASAGLLHMLSLPFSNTAHFKFNPDPMLAAILVTIAFPFLTSIILVSASSMAKRRFGHLFSLGASFVAVAILTTIIPDEKITISIPFYLINLIPITVADVILSNSARKPLAYLAGAILGISFFTLYFPLITHAYNEVLTTTPVWPSAIIGTYFADFPRFFPVVALPAILSGVFGAIASGRLRHK
ncbi:MAG TPA: hypothetical protein VJ792_06760 [Candidatus Nitrosotalea sp.]|nr:hypothetical protein [Candidatus Nitrosotalea sp.]